MEHRSEIIRLRESERLSEREIARQLQLPPSTVHYWLAKEETREQGRRGRPRVTTVEEDHRLYDASINHPFQSAVHLRDEVTPGVSVDTVRKRLKERGLRCRIPARKPFLSPTHIEKRLEFARHYQFWGVDDWARVIFSDEKIFRSSSTGRLRVYRPRESNRFRPEYLHLGPVRRSSICVWLAFGRDFKAIHRVEQPTLNSEYYAEVILERFIREHFEQHQGEDLIFQQDLSSIHRSRRSLHWLETRNIPWMDDWPAKGPDMNPVENVWAELVRRIRNNPTNPHQLWENVYNAFLELDQNYFNNLIISMPRRIRKVVEAQGHWTKY